MTIMKDRHIALSNLWEKMLFLKTFSDLKPEVTQSSLSHSTFILVSHISEDFSLGKLVKKTQTKSLLKLMNDMGQLLSFLVEIVICTLT